MQKKTFKSRYELYEYVLSAQWSLWIQPRCEQSFIKLKKRLTSALVLVIPDTSKTFWGLVWCFTSEIELCLNTREYKSCICFNATQSSWDKLLYLWLRVGSDGVCFEDLKTLFIWSSNSDVQWILVWSERVEHEVEKMGGVYERLWFPADVLSREG